jgi:hypothetical protein
MEVSSKEYPIIFNAWSIRAILEERKTQTRRIVKSQPNKIEDEGHLRSDLNQIPCIVKTDAEGADYLSPIDCPYGQPGDVLIPAEKLSGYDIEYAVDVFGNVWSKSTGDWKKLKTQVTSGYERLTLRKDGRDVNRTVHRLAAAAFYDGPTDELDVVRHLDGDPLNNAVENLDWGTYKQNWKDRKYHGNGIHSEHHNAKLTMKKAGQIRESDKTVTQIADEFGLDRKTVRRVLNEETWVEVDEQPPPNMPRELCRLRLRVESVRVERLQEISHHAAEAEGVRVCNPQETPRDLFRMKWNDIHGIGAWEENPWVWVVAFSKIDTE